MTRAPYQHAVFLLSAAELHQLPSDQGSEVAFIGRSNAGKSSAINAITGIKGLARTSKTPGRTQLINLFALDEHRRLVDLPGYGYAKVPFSVKERWQQTVNQYLQQRCSLRGLVLIMDVRHPMKDLDQHLLKWAATCDIPVHILLTKVDKLKHSEAMQTLRRVEKEVELYSKVTVQAFSSLTHDGLEDVLLQLDTWLTGD